MSELVKKQHFVPRTYLKQFGSERGNETFIYVLPRIETTPDKIFESNIMGIAQQKHLYTMPGETIEQKMAIEKFYSNELERHYTRMYSILIDPLKTTINEEERELIISTVITMFYRTTRWISIYKKGMLSLFETMFNACELTGQTKFDFDGKKISIEGRSLQEFSNDFFKSTQPAMVLTQLEVAYKLIPLKINDSLICVEKLEGDLEFITSDNPVNAYNPYNDRIAPFDSKNVFELPIDSKHKLVLSPLIDQNKDAKSLILRKSDTGDFSKVNKLLTNYNQMQMSERFLFGSKTALESYLLTKEASERPMSKDELKDTENLGDQIQKGKDLGIF